ncbi:MAG: hypothetical protein A3H97_05090 [Acidobacteria bacterium RIFCSPLOWO2_02_FULL_65_29]|nr:MAG: hypothetical protein A3H97_05090 [Acidobacteria bacterium RIFCSPLOWO2_02_FULL_65_29]
MLPEALYTDWASKQIADYFTAAGFRVRYSAVTQPVEAVYPFDRLYAFNGADGPFAVFALQFKSPQRGAEGLLRFRLDLTQLRALQKPTFHDWVFYAFPYFTDVRFQQECLHLTNFTRPLQIPSLEPRSSFSLHWRAPFLMIESAGADGPAAEELEPYKMFDDFAATGKTEWALARRACTFSDGTLRYEVPHISWGELFQALMTLRAGRHILQPVDIEHFIGQLREVPQHVQNSVLVALDLVRRTIEIVAVLPEAGEQTDEQGGVSF